MARVGDRFARVCVDPVLCEPECRVETARIGEDRRAEQRIRTEICAE